MINRNYIPCKPLEPYIAWYWTLENTNIDYQIRKYRFIPDGYVDWVFHIGSAWEFSQNTPHLPLQHFKNHTFNQCTGFIDLKLNGESVQVFGVKFQPWAASLFWNMSMNESTNQNINLRDLPVEGITNLIELVQLANSTKERIQHVENFLLKRIIPFENLKTHFKCLSADSFDKKQVFNNRRIQQRFRSEVGISPKTYWRTVRINRVIFEMIQHKTRLTDIAYRLGYFDQAHLIRDFKKFTGLNPSKFLKSIKPSEDFFNLRIE